MSDVRLTNFTELISSVPALIGYVPGPGSLVLICVRKDTDSGQTHSFTVRADLPPAEHRRALVSYLIDGVLRRGSVDLVAAVIVGGQQRQQWELITLLVDAFGNDVALHPVWTPSFDVGVRWCCYQNPEECSGVLGDVNASELAAVNAVLGRRIWASRDELAASVGPGTEHVRTDIARRVAERRANTAAAVKLCERTTPVFDALETLRAGAVLETSELVGVLEALVDGAPIVDLLVRIEDTAAMQLWTILMPLAPDSVVVEVASLLALSAHRTGDAALANVALERALRLSPDHTLARLIEQVVATCSPHEVRELLAPAAA